MGNAKISNFDLSTVLCPKEVGRFDVPMDDSLMVQIFETEHGIS
jgi:uncharacterized secreted protein with C-terminal beta-propeller domain